MPARPKKRASARLRPDYATFGEGLQELRQEAGMTQASLASALGVTQSWVAKTELGERRIDVLELLDYLRALGVDPAEYIATLWTREEKNRRAKR
jgi:transcriptional regulator with XRE-family HTH domain